ncbi:MAG: PepSY domain-containing protein [Pseudomonadales bacterium]
MRSSIITICLGLAFLSGVAGAIPASASPFAQVAEVVRMAEFKGAPENKFLPGKPRARVGEKKAASRAKSAFPEAKILSVHYRNGAYRVKLLSDGGVVKYVFVDPDSGEVFE